MKRSHFIKTFLAGLVGTPLIASRAAKNNPQASLTVQLDPVKLKGLVDQMAISIEKQVRAQIVAEKRRGGLI